MNAPASTTCVICGVNVRTDELVDGGLCRGCADVCWKSEQEAEATREEEGDPFPGMLSAKEEQDIFEEEREREEEWQRARLNGGLDRGYPRGSSYSDADCERQEREAKEEAGSFQNANQGTFDFMSWFIRTSHLRSVQENDALIIKRVNDFINYNK